MYGNHSAAKQNSAECSNRDYDFFYDGLELNELRIQTCDNCGQMRNPPSPMCPKCQSLAWSPRVMSGQGTIFSYTIHHHPPLPGFTSPHPVGVVELQEGIRFVSGLDGIAPEDVAIGVPVEAEFLRRGNLASVRFKLA